MWYLQAFLCTIAPVKTKCCRKDPVEKVAIPAQMAG